MNSKKQIDEFLAPKKVAIAGVSRNPKKFGYVVFDELRKKGFDVAPVNPNATEIDGVACYASISDLPDEYDRLMILTPKEKTDDLLMESVKKGIPNVWVQQMSDTRKTAEIAKEHDISLVSKECIFMFAEPVTGVHKFHRAIKKFFGMFPK